MTEEHKEKMDSIIKEVRKIHPMMGSRSIYYTAKNTLNKDLGLGVTAFEKYMSITRQTINVRKKHWTKTSDGLGKENYPNLINGLILNSYNQLIVGDITYYTVEDEKCYIFTLKAVYSQRILGLILSKTLKLENAILCLESAYKLRKGEDLTGCIHHSDNGSQYNAGAYKSMLLNSGLVISRADNCLENGSAENLNNIIKNMYLDHFGIKTFAKLKSACNDLIVVLNEQKPIKELGWLTPVQFEKIIKELPLDERPKKQLYDFTTHK
jgi:putative transposase